MTTGAIEIVEDKLREAKSKLHLAKYLADETYLIRSYFNYDTLGCSPDKEIFNDIDTGDLDEINNLNVIEKMMYKTNSNIRIKLVMAEVNENPVFKTLRSLTSPILTSFHLNAQFGYFHTALIVGPYYLEWNSSSLCVPRTCYSKAAILCLDIGSGLGIGNSQQVIKKLATRIVEWNTTKTYSLKNNCQHFVEDLLGILDINVYDQFQKNGRIHQLLSQIKNKGKADFKYYPSNELKELLKLEKNDMKFETHADLDKFVISIAKLITGDEFLDIRDPNVKKSPYFEDLVILKSMDRSFWLRHFGMKDQPSLEFEPLTRRNKSNVKVCNCPFGDPIDSNSMGDKSPFFAESTKQFDTMKTLFKNNSHTPPKTNLKKIQNLEPKVQNIKDEK
jgi:hypothetical protein